MNTPNTASFFKHSIKMHWSFFVATLALFAGLTLSILSLLGICVEHCSATHDYRLLGLPFAFVGIAFFAVLLTLHFMSPIYPKAERLGIWLLAMALGSEMMFIIVQKNQIGHWCPVCLSIAASVLVAGIALSQEYFRNMYTAIQTHHQEEIMRGIKQASTSLFLIAVGFLIALFGVTKPNLAEAAAKDMKQHLKFGSNTSPVEVYFVTDWFCASCKKTEPVIEKIYPKIASQASFFFIDYPIHQKSQNFTPYNLALMINNKPEYFQARHALAELAKKKDDPTDEDVMEVMKKHNIDFKELTFLDVKSGIDFFDEIKAKYQLNSTPTLVIVNTRNGEFKKLLGASQIDEKQVLKEIEKIKESAEN